MDARLGRLSNRTTPSQDRSGRPRNRRPGHKPRADHQVRSGASAARRHRGNPESATSPAPRVQKPQGITKRLEARGSSNSPVSGTCLQAFNSEPESGERFCAQLQKFLHEASALRGAHIQATFCDLTFRLFYFLSYRARLIVLQKL